MRAVESEGNTVEQAVERALILLDLSRDQVEVSVIQQPQPGGGTAVVRVAPKSATRVSDSPVSRETPATAGGVSKPHREVGEEDPSPEEKDQAKGVLAELLSRMNLACRLEPAEIEGDGQRIRLTVTGEDTALIIGKQGQTLDAIELIVNRIVERRWPGSNQITVDAVGYRERRARKLADVALEQAEKVRRMGESIALEPMTPRDRRSVHMALHDETGVSTRSEGEGSFRHIIIEPAGPLGIPGSRSRIR
jgi:spoIIIJ-associated protein